jgi:hypothetical protein
MYAEEIAERWRDFLSSGRKKDPLTEHIEHWNEHFIASEKAKELSDGSGTTGPPIKGNEYWKERCLAAEEYIKTRSNSTYYSWKKYLVNEERETS